MDVRCAQCGTEYEFEEARIGDAGITVKCTACSHVFKIHRPGTEPRATAAKEWLVRKPDGQVVAFRELTTLQKWIVEGRIDRDDEISKNSETWKRLGNIKDLEPFFSVFERARALNDLMVSGALGDRPLTVNGSEVLAAASPLSSIVAASSPLPSRLRASGPEAPSEAALTGFGAARTDDALGRASLGMVAAANGHESGAIALQPLEPPARPSETPPRRASVVTRQFPARPDRARGPSMATRRPDLLGFEADGELETPLPADSLLPGPGTPARITPVPPAGRAASGAALPSQPTSETMPVVRPERTPVGAAPGARSANLGAAERATDPPPAAPRALDGFELDERVLEDVERPSRRRRRSGGARAGVAIGVFVALGLGGGAALATFGPDENPLRRWATGIGLLPPSGERSFGRDADPSRTEILEPAHRALERDTEADLEEAERLLTPAAVEQRDADAQAELALVLSTRAASLRRQAERNEARAEQLRVSGGRAEDMDALKTQSQALQRDASRLMARAFELVRAAYTASPESLAANRALADYYRVQKDQSGNLTRFVEQAKAMSASSNTIDAATAYVEAAELARELPAMIGLSSALDGGRADRAMTLLEQALTARPGLVRARVLRARLLAARSQGPLARAELEQVIAAVPEHGEAKELLDDLARLEPRAGAAAATASAPPSPDAPQASRATPSASSSSESPVASPNPAARASAAPRPAASQTTSPSPASVPSRISPAPRVAEVARTDSAPSASAEPSGTSDRGGAKGNVAGKGFDALMKQAERLRQRGEAWEALLSYEKASELRPGAGRAYAGMGWCYLDLSKPEAALHQFRKAIAVDGGYAEGHLGHAEAYRALGNADKALASYRQFLALKPQGTEAEAARRAIASLEGGR